ncbi:MAG: ATP-binding protein [Leifsonia sp.]
MVTAAKTPPAPLNMKEGWAAFADAPADPPEPLTLKQVRALPEDAKTAYDDARLRYMVGQAVVRTPQLDTILSAARTLVHLNEHKPYGKLGLIVSGEAALGKTTIVTRVGREHERRRRGTGHPAGAPGSIPVAYVTVPPACTSKAMTAELARFFALPTHARMSQTDMLAAIAHTVRSKRTELIIVDEIHNLDMNYRINAEAADALKDLSEKCSATFIYSGVDVESCGLLDGLRGQQIAARFTLHRVTPFSNRSRTSREEWRRLLVALTATLTLAAQKPDGLLPHADALYAHSGGSIGRLTRTLHLCAITAITDGSERITTATLKNAGVSTRD